MESRLRRHHGPPGGTPSLWGGGVGVSLDGGGQPGGVQPRGERSAMWGGVSPEPCGEVSPEGVQHYIVM